MSKKEITQQAFDGSKLRNLFTFLQTLWAILGLASGQSMTQQLTAADYLGWLKKIVSLGSKLPRILAALKTLYDIFVEDAIVTPTPGGLEMVEMDDETIQAETEVLCLVNDKE